MTDPAVAHSKKRRRSSSVTDLFLFCCLVDSNTPFPISIPSSHTVAVLKEKIKEEKPNDLKEIDANKLELFKVSIPDEGDLAQKTEDAVRNSEPLRSTTELIEIFLDEPPKWTIHIVVRLPIQAELFRSLGINESNESSLRPSEDGPSEDEVIGALKESMAEPFRGSSAYALFEYLTDCHQRFATGSFYARFLSICNSSGTGKTRAILELRNFDIPVLYMNISSDRENFPPSDNDIVRLFWPGSYSSADDYYHACLKIFCAVFELLGLEFSKPDQNLDEMISSWNEKYTEDVSIDNGNRPEFFKKVRNLFGQMRGNCSDSKRRLLEAYKRLCQHLKSPGRFLVLALDESHVITQAKGIGYSPSYVLGRTIADFTSRMNGPAVWVLFCSTNSEITHFVAPAPFYNSAGIAKDGQLLFAPFSYLEWDVYAECGDELDVLSVGEFKTMICFGRPLWKSVLKLHTDPSSMTEYALDKLLFPQGEYGPGERACLALLSQRFALDIALDNYQAESFVINGIASHMRYLVSTSEYCTRQRSIYPSEPVLSHAAAVHMYRSPDNLNNLLSTLRRQISSGLIQAGELGELLGRFLCIIL